MKRFFRDEPYLYRSFADGLIRRCVPEVEILSVLEACHSSPVSGHNSSIWTAHKVLQCGYYWPTIHQDAHEFAKASDRCQRDGDISRKQELPLNPILVIELFDVWGIEFMGPFMSSHGMNYILVAVDYVSKLVKAIALANNEGKSVTAFLRKNILSRFGTQGQLFVMGDPTFATNCSRDYCRNMGWTIMCPLLTILKLVGKLNCQIGRSNRNCKKQ